MSWLVFVLLSIASFVLALFAPWTWLAALAALTALLLLFAAAFALLAERVGSAARPDSVALSPEAHAQARERTPDSTVHEGKRLP